MGDEPTGDTVGREVVVQRINGVHEGEHRGSAMGVRSLVGRKREQEAARSRNKVGIMKEGVNLPSYAHPFNYIIYEIIITKHPVPACGQFCQ